MWQVAALLGLRKSELLGLRWSRVDLEGASVLIDTTLHRHGLDEKTKTASSRRRVPLRLELVEALVQHRAVQRVERLRAGVAWNHTHPDHVFTNETGEPIKPDWATRAFKRLCHRVGLPVPGKPNRRGLEGLRHTRASIGPEFGEATAITAAILGHSSGALTLDVYTSLPVEVLRSAQLPGWDLAAGVVPVAKG
jgi:integrase